MPRVEPLVSKTGHGNPMRSLLRRTASLPLFALAALTLGLAGCGGNGNDDDGANPFAGEYPGIYTTAQGDSGTIQVTIAESGRFEGSATASGSNTIGGINGRVSRSGHFTGTVTSASASANFEYEGDLERRSDGVIDGTLSATDDSGAPDVTIRLGVFAE